MTIEIRQLVIRAVVDAGAADAPDALPGMRPRERAAAAPPAAPGTLPADSAALVSACVREVLRQLERSRDR
jgi:hypothetical protein